ncbi:MAG: hypothetical protein ACFFCM_09265 [Promethearchaeota archaeon]
MRVVEIDPQTFLDIYPPSFSELKSFIMGTLDTIHDKKGVLLALKENGSYSGRVMAFIDSTYESYGEKVGSFGWIYGARSKHLKLLLSVAEEYLKAQGVAVIRGPRNDPVFFGGQGILVHGFNQPLLFGIPENEIWLGRALQKCGYDYNTQYYCIRWNAPYSRWTDKKDSEILLTNLEYEDMEDRASEIAQLYNNCMKNMPDMTKLDRFSVINFIHFYRLINAKDFLFFALCDDKIVGLAVLIPNLYDLWSRNPIRNLNWYIADVSREYRGRFIFSAMKNAVMNLLDKKKIPAYEGTYIWDENQQMIDMCLRTGKLVRKHLIFSKDLNGGA